MTSFVYVWNLNQLKKCHLQVNAVYNWCSPGVLCKTIWLAGVLHRLYEVLF